MGNYDPDDPVAVYINEIGAFKLLTADEERTLLQELARARAWDGPSESVARRLIEGHLAQVVSIAEKHSDSGVPMLELIEQGNLGLMNAVGSFAEKQMGDFTQYAAVCIEDAIKKALA
jgi:DNA-directed RNA polymerase sigma subunit (sigma70/sigma32)